MDQGVRWTPRLCQWIGNPTAADSKPTNPPNNSYQFEQVSEERLVELLEQVSSQEKKATKVTIVRRRFDEDDDDNDDDLL